ncbi:MAG TPA: LPS export ABC transporter permease LptF [Caulobacteraceae bacterium]
MILLERYLLRQLLIPTLLALAALTVVAFLSQSLSALNLIVDERQSLGIFVKVTVLALPELISLILPVAVFVAAAIALNRMHTEHEIVVCFAGGMSRWEVIAPAMRIAAFAALASLALNLWIAPQASQALRTTLFQARADLAASLIKPGEFSQPSPGLTVYAQSTTPGGALTDIFVHQQRAASSTTFSADTGQITKRGDAPMLIMRHGSSQELTPSGVLNYLAFDEYALDLSPFLAGGDELHFKTSDRYLHELVFPDLTQAWERQYRKKMLSEAASRLVSPLYNIAFMAIALAAVIGGSFTRLGYNGRIIAAAGVAAAVRLLGFAAQAFATHSVWMNLLQLAVPAIVTAIALHRLFPRRIGGRVRGPRGGLSLAGARP